MIVLSLDQASKMGFSIFEDGKLTTYGLGDFSKYKDGERLFRIREEVIDLIEQHQPDYVSIEDCQMQFSPKVFKSLAMLQGVLRELFYELDIPCEVVSPSTWRSVCGIKGRKREEQKANALMFIERMFGLTGNIDDIADAICMGYWLSKEVSKKCIVKDVVEN